MVDDLNFFSKMEDDLIFQLNERQHQFQQNGRRPQFFYKMEDDLNFLTKWKTTSNVYKIKDDLNLF